jgi:hypothetical protein
MAAKTYVVDLRDYLDDNDYLADMPGPALNLAMVFTSIVAWATDHEPEDIVPTNVWCWRRPSGKRCRSELIAERQHDSAEIFRRCRMCGVNGVIRGWEESLWDAVGRQLLVDPGSTGTPTRVVTVVGVVRHLRLRSPTASRHSRERSAGVPLARILPDGSDGYLRRDRYGQRGGWAGLGTSGCQSARMGANTSMTTAPSGPAVAS